MHAFVAVLRTALTEETAVRRREIIAQHPTLRGRLAQLIAQVEELVREAMQRAAERREDAGDEESRQVLLMLAGVIIKHAFTRYYEGGAAGQDGAGASDREMDVFLEESISLFRDALQRSSGRGAGEPR